ncbi:MAG: type II toxin-antitoxin system HicB family antitoxin [Parabacteroides sp.]|nr:type II toxin-antitoxin system HicB family antitoxin [Parabacteroides sp.]
MGQLKYKGYIGSVEYSEEDNCLYGKVLGMNKDLISYEGDTVDDLKKDFEGAIDDYLASCKDRGVEPRKPFSGKLNLRMSSELHSRVAAIAANTGTTINDFINRAITKELEHGCAM